MYNYFYCVTTNPGTHDSKYFKMLVKDAVLSGDLPPDVLDRDESSATKGEHTESGDVDDSQPLLNATAQNADIRNRLANESNHAGDAVDNVDYESSGSGSYIINNERARKTNGYLPKTPMLGATARRATDRNLHVPTTTELRVSLF